MATPTEAPLWAMCEGGEAMLVLLQGRSVTVGVPFIAIVESRGL